MGQVMYLLCLLFLAFIGGAVVAVADAPPAGQIRSAYEAGTALYAKFTSYSDPLATDLWNEARWSERGVTVNRDDAQPGLTLYTSGHAAEAYLIDLDGKVVHRWSKPFSAVWDDTAAAKDPVSDEQVHFVRAHVYPNGTLLAIYSGVGDSPYGYGMVMLGRDSQVLWKNLAHFHHDVTVSEDGLIYGLTHEFRQTPVEGVDHLEPPFLDDDLVIVSPADGRVVKRLSLLDAVNESDFRRYLWHVPYYSLGDPLHTNTVKVLTEQDAATLAEAVPAAQAGQVLLSFRELSVGSLGLLDLEQKKLVWARRGSWLAQHDPDILEDGRMLLFDNRGHFGAENRSRVIEIDPASGEVLWSYSGSGEKALESPIRGSQQRLANGNTLITESAGGRLVEVTRDGDIAWEFLNPVRAGEDNEKIPIVSGGQRIDPQLLAADFRAQVQGVRHAMNREVNDD